MVFGNSHSVMWVPALSLIAKAEGWKLYPIVREACAYEVFVNLGQIWIPKIRAHLLQLGQSDIKRLHPDVIVMGSYDETPRWIAGEEQIIRQLKPMTKRFILLGDDVQALRLNRAWPKPARRRVPVPDLRVRTLTSYKRKRSRPRGRLTSSTYGP